MSKLNYNLLRSIQKNFEKKAFVPGSDMGGAPADGGAPMDPAAMDPAAMGGAPMDPAMAGGAPMDPAMAGGAPMDPAAMGGAPMDPAMMGGAMPPGLDPAMMGMLPPPEGEGKNMITMSSDEFLKFVKQIVALCTNSKFGGDTTQQAAPTDALAAKLDAILARLS